MSALVRFGDSFLCSFITRIIFVHLMICVFAIASAFAFPILLWSFIESTRLPSALLAEGKKIEAPLVRDEGDRWSKATSSYLCHVQYGDFTYPCLRPEKPVSLQSLTIYDHPLLGTPGSAEFRVVEVPEHADWASVYRAVESHPLSSAITSLVVVFLAACLLIYAAIRGYWLIKRGPQRRYRHR